MNPQPSFLMASLYVAIGGAVGSWLRFATGRLVGPGTFPWATLTVNVVGSFAMGLLAGWLARQSGGDGEGWRLLVGVGLLGGFTTFSAFTLDIAQMLERGALPMSVGYIVASLVAGILGLFAGLALMRSFT